MICLSIFFLSCTGFDPKSKKNIKIMVTSGSKYLSALTMTEDRMADIARKGILEMDSKEKIAPYSSNYSIRLSKLTQVFRTINGRPLNFRVYLKPEINAFAMPDGSIRIFSGLMDYMNNDGELIFVVGHEIGHVACGHSQQRFKLAYSARATRELASMSNYGDLISSGAGDFLEAVINAQFSQANEREADDYGLATVQRAGYNPMEAVSALEKLVYLSGNNYNIVARIISTHPAPGDRARRLKDKIYEK